jgi:hypothetical protein
VAPVDGHREEKEQWKVRHVRIMAACVVAACAICALAAANASAALPEWGKCVKLPAEIKGKEHKAGTGKFANSNCTEATTGGEYEFLKGTSGLPNTEFTNKMTTPEAVLELSIGIQVRCTGQTATGHISGTKEVSDVEVAFTGCKAPALEFACETKIVNESSEEHPVTFKYIEGEINTRSLKGKTWIHLGQGHGKPGSRFVARTGRKARAVRILRLRIPRIHQFGADSVDLLSSRREIQGCKRWRLHHFPDFAGQ